MVKFPRTPTFVHNGLSPAENFRMRRNPGHIILSDTGGSTGYRCRAWKTELQSQLADSHGLTLTVAHYPTGASQMEPHRASSLL
jgi:hypothetical protein